MDVRDSVWVEQLWSDGRRPHNSTGLTYFTIFCQVHFSTSEQAIKKKKTFLELSYLVFYSAPHSQRSTQKQISNKFKKIHQKHFL